MVDKQNIIVYNLEKVLIILPFLTYYFCFDFIHSRRTMLMY